MSVPNFRPWKITVILLVKYDVGHHPIVPLVLKQCFNFNPGTLYVKVCEPNGGQAAVPVPLEWVQSMCWNGISSLIVGSYSRNRLVNRLFHF
jgi:hypothetical protein